MLKFTKNNVIKITTIFIFVIIGFIFIHSELDQFSYDVDHNEHDYCDLVDGATLQLTKTSNSLLKLKIDKVTSLNSTDVITKLLSFSFNKEIDSYCLAKKPSKLYLYNSTFLI